MPLPEPGQLAVGSSKSPHIPSRTMPSFSGSYSIPKAIPETLGSEDPGKAAMA